MLLPDFYKNHAEFFNELSCFMEAIFWILIFFFWIVSGLKSKPSRKASVHIRLSLMK